MRQITKNSIKAFYNKEAFKSSNTQVTIYNNKSCLWLHGNCIATHENGLLKIDSCGWFTNTTKERLNALEGVNIYQRNFVWYLNGKEWNGSLTEIKN